MRYLPLAVLGLLVSGCVPNPDVLTMREESAGDGARDTLFLRNGQLSSQEISAIQDGRRVNVWRYYEEGRLIREDIDTNFDGLVDTIKIYEPKSAVVIRILRDTDFDGSFDSEIDYDANGIARPLPGTPVPPARPTTAPVTSSTQPNTAPTPPVPQTPDVRDNGADETSSVSSDDGYPQPPVPQPAQENTTRPARLDAILGPSATTDTADTTVLDNTNDDGTPPASTMPPAPADTTDGTLIQRITPPRRLESVAPAGSGSSGIVPDATFRHPSSGLEE